MAGARAAATCAAPAGWSVRPDELAARSPRRGCSSAQHAAQPDRQGVHARRAGAHRPRSAASTTWSVLADEVYEHLVFEGGTCRSPRSPGMAERTVTISSLGKTFSLTGWKIGWAIGPAPLVAAVRAAQQFLTFAAATPLQHAGAAALGLADDYFTAFVAELPASATACSTALRAAGLQPSSPQAGTYFVIADGRPGDGRRVLPRAPERAGVAAIPPRCSTTPSGAGAYAGALRVLQARRGARRGGGAARERRR